MSLRPESADDEPFLRDLYASTRAEELAVVPWTNAQRREFCDSQFTAQAAHYRSHYPGAQFLVVELAGVAVGRLYLHRSPGELRIVDIAILPDHRRRGIGAALLRAVMTEASAEGLDVSLHVEANNPIMAFYRRLGFRRIEDRAPYVFMRWSADASPPPAGFS